MISTQYNCAYLRAPKAASSTLKSALRGIGFIDHGVTVASVNPCRTRNSYVEALWNTYPYLQPSDFFKFTFVRNPWDRAVSCWKFLCSRSLDRLIAPCPQSFLDFLTAYPFNTTSQGNDWYYHTRPQGEHTGNDLNFIGRVETIDVDFGKLSDIVGWGTIALQRLNVTDGRSMYQNYYDDDTRALVESIYAEDIETFGYSYAEL